MGTKKPFRNIKHGFYRKKEINERKAIREFLKTSKETLNVCLILKAATILDDLPPWLATLNKLKITMS